MNIAIIKRRAGRWALNGAATVALLYILTPLIFVTWLAFFRQEIPSFPPEGYSLRWFKAIFDQPKFVEGFSLVLPGRRAGDRHRPGARACRPRSASRASTSGCARRSPTCC